MKNLVKLLIVAVLCVVATVLFTCGIGDTTPQEPQTAKPPAVIVPVPAVAGLGPTPVKEEEPTTKVPEVLKTVRDAAYTYVLDTVENVTQATTYANLCEAAVYHLSPDWRLGVCDIIREPERKQACIEAKAPLYVFTHDICWANALASLRYRLDPLLGVAVMERESSIGRVTYNNSKREYEVNTDVCKLFLSSGRIVNRAPGRREGRVRLTWTYGDNNDQNTQDVTILEETAEGLQVDTCAAGEAGLFQLLPGNYRRQATRVELIADPSMQVKIGMYELARHRDLHPENERTDWLLYIGTYNTGSTDRTGEKWQEYRRKIVRHYLNICEASVGGTTLIRDVWSECARIAESS